MPPLRVLRLGNPIVRTVLGSPAHGALSGSLAVLAYTGARTGRVHRIPVLYAEHGDDVLVLAAQPARKRWWRRFREPAPATLRLRGRDVPVEGWLLQGEARATALAVYLDRFPRARGALGSSATDALDDADAAIVRFARRSRGGAEA